MATLTATGGVKQVVLSGAAFTGSSVIVSVSFSAAGRRYNELRQVPVAAGTVASTVPVPFAGTATVSAFDPSSFATQATAAAAAVT